jgi:hypothetical protein
VYYGLADAQQAADYVRDPMLGERLVASAAAVRTHLAKAAPAPLKELMALTLTPSSLSRA